jgi:Ca2+-binding RTX toxin-like protein
MTDLTVTVALAGLADLQYDEVTGILYLSTSAGGFLAWNPQTGAFVNSISLPGGPSYTGAFDITPDGQYAILSAGASGTLDRIQLSNLSVQPLTVSPALAFGALDVTSDSEAIAAAGGADYSFNASGSQISPAAIPTMGAGYLTKSEDGRYVLGANLTGRPGPLWIYDSASHSIVAYSPRALVSFGQSGGDINSASKLAVFTEYTDTTVYDFNLNVLHSFQGGNSGISGAHFSEDGHQLYLFNSNLHEIDVYDTSSWTEIGSAALGAGFSFGPPGASALSPDGRFLFVETSSGFAAIDLASRLHLTLTGDATHTYLVGSPGSDTITGSAANDTIDGRGGNDVLDGGGGVNTVSFASATTGVTVSLALQGSPQTTGVGSVTLSNFQNITGSAYADTLIGDANNNVINGGGGNDTLTGGGGADTFVMTPGAGADVITDFSYAQDQIDLSNLYRFTTFAQVMAGAHQSGPDVVMSLTGSSTLTLQNVTLASLTAADFVLTPNSTLTVGNTTVTTDPAFNLSLTSGALVQFTDPAGGTLINNGALTLDNPSSSSTAVFAVLTAAPLETGAVFENHGTFSVTAAAGLGVSSATVHNYGTFSVTGGVSGGEGATGDFLNYGTVTVQGATDAVSLVYGDYDSSGQLFQNQPGATFQVTAQGNAAGVVLANGGQFSNGGNLTVSATGAAEGAVIDVTGAATTIVNSGAITVTGATSTGILVNTSGAAVAVTLQNTGVITAQTAISDTGPYGASITNSGTLNGAVTLGGAANTLDSHAGTITGVVTLGAGSSTVTLGAEDNTVVLGAGTHVVDGGGGTNTASYANASAGVTVSLALQGQAQSTGVGTDTLTHFQALVGSTYNDTLTAGIGASTLTGGLGADTFKAPSNATAVVITDFSHAQGDRIDLSAFARFSSWAGVQTAMTQNGADTVISTASGTVTLQNVQASSLTASDFQLFGAPAGGPPLQINVTYDSSVNNAPAGFKLAVQTAVQFFERTFSSAVPINIAVGWGEVHGNTMDPSALAESMGNYDNLYTYQQVRSALATADARSPTASAAIASLPAVDPTNGATFVMTTAEEKALGLYTGGSSTIDGYIGLSSTGPYAFAANNRAVPGDYDAIGAIEHEISEVLGRNVIAGQPMSIPSHGTLNVDQPLDLFRYTAPNVHSFTPGPNTYFSVDGGATYLKNFNDGTLGGDDGDWATTGAPDASDAFAGVGVEADLSTADARVLELLGYGLSSVSMLSGGPTVGPGLAGFPRLAPPAGGAVNGTAGSDWLQGGAGNDTLHGGGGSDYLDGGAGLNTALYDGGSRQYVVSPGSGTVAGGPEGGTDELVNIQRIQFVDGYLAISPTDTAGQVYRVYEATLGRAPDQEGLTNWVTQLNAGASLQSVVDGFVNSQEFLNKYGASLSNAQFVTLLYENVLHREPDPSGLNNWVGYLTTGAMTRAQVVTGFSESPEDVNDLAAPVQQGLWIADAAAGEVARMYDAVFGRLPDGGGLANWTHTLENGGTLQGVANGFVGSPEFQQTYGNLNNHDFVTLLYHNVLHRDPDTAGLNNWVANLAGGETRAQVVVGFSESPEHIGETAPYIDSGVWLTG